MKSKRARLDRFLSQQLGINKKDTRLFIAQGRVQLDHQTANSVQQLVDEYTHVSYDGKVLQNKTPCYIQLNKPKGVVSATKDSEHTTVVDLLPNDTPSNVHIVGRLDFNSTGLVLLTNDGRWSRDLMEPNRHVAKRYRVTLDKPVTPEVIEAFQQGMYFAFEQLTTRPATLIPAPSEQEQGQYSAEVILQEGRYHQIKRMFGHFDITVLTLHRFAVGGLILDEHLAEGQSRHLQSSEVTAILTPH